MPAINNACHRGHVNMSAQYIFETFFYTETDGNHRVRINEVCRPSDVHLPSLWISWSCKLSALSAATAMPDQRQ